MWWTSTGLKKKKDFYPECISNIEYDEKNKLRRYEISKTHKKILELDKLNWLVKGTTRKRKEDPKKILTNVTKGELFPWRDNIIVADPD